MQTNQELTSDIPDLYIQLAGSAGTLVEQLEDTINEFDNKPSATLQTHIKVLRSLLTNKPQPMGKEFPNDLSRKIADYLDNIPNKTVFCCISREEPLKTRLQAELKKHQDAQQKKANSGEMVIKTKDYLKLRNELQLVVQRVGELEKSLMTIQTERNQLQIKLNNTLNEKKLLESKNARTIDTQGNFDKLVDMLQSRITELETDLIASEREAKNLSVMLEKEKQRNESLFQAIIASEGGIGVSLKLADSKMGVSSENQHLKLIGIVQT